MNPVIHPKGENIPDSNQQKVSSNPKVPNGMKKITNDTPAPYRAVITGCGSFVPDKILTNDDLAKMVDTSDEWITSRTGIKIRHIADGSETTALLATKAAKKALAEANLDPADLDLLILATVTPEMPFPATSCFVQSAIGAKKACVFDLHAACSGFIYSLGVVQQFLESGRYNNALVIGAETLTKITNWKDRASCILFGDGAGAVVLERKNNGSGILYSTMSADGENWAALNCQAYGSRNPPDKKLDDPNKIYMEIKGRQVYQQAIRRIVETVNQCLEICDLKLDDISMMISHQMNGRIIESAAKRLNLPDEKVFINITDYGNTSAASVPMAFDECVKQGKVKQGDIIIFVAFGAGLTWGANIVRL